MRFILLAAIALTAPVGAQTLPAALATDPPRDAAHPARLEQVRYATGGVQVAARLFVAAGAGIHPTVLLLHGFPGTELNLDLARVLQRAGWNVLAIHYRGVWGAPGQFSFSHTVEDAHAAIAWLRSPAAAAYGVDPTRIVALGHSMGGFDTLMLGDDKALAGYVLISAADMAKSAEADSWTADKRADFADEASYTNASVEALTADAAAHGAAWNWTERAAQLAGRPVLVLTSDDGLAPLGEAAARSIVAAGGPKPTVVHMTTDHSYNDHRVALAATVAQWLAVHFPSR
ncbi:alpha/beta hydrolase family protein [Sphingomonas abietis]|uniref:Alpha/beta hydrolase n=1 Tax=Sphingomonas abietis TaxID=3012344 RepID=A0ABY7NJV5_9SPHN|nr:alpha/beta hydrolase [Sphingomonas abietis]WBO21527.1 alpha/beta hydrolase [Sphingomonas abietis]